MTAFSILSINLPVNHMPNYHSYLYSQDEIISGTGSSENEHVCVCSICVWVSIQGHKKENNFTRFNLFDFNYITTLDATLIMWSYI